MASIQRVKNSPNYTIRFRFQGRNVHRSLGTGDRRKATGICSRIEETIRLLESGRIELPNGTDPIEFIFSDGKQPEKRPRGKALGLTEFYATYKEKLPEGRKEASTLDGEREFTSNTSSGILAPIGRCSPSPSLICRTTFPAASKKSITKSQFSRIRFVRNW